MYRWKITKYVIVMSYYSSLSTGKISDLWNTLLLDEIGENHRTRSIKNSKMSQVSIWGENECNLGRMYMTSLHFCRPFPGDSSHAPIDTA